MIVQTFVKSLLPKSYSFFDQTIALTIIYTSLAISLAMVCLVLYWVITKSFETVRTIFAMLGIMLVLAVCIWLEITGQISAGAWTLVIVTILLNIANLVGYGISTSASSGFVLSILLAFFCLGPGTGYAVTITGCILVFIIPILHSKGRILTSLQYQTSSITFDAPTLSLVYILIAVITGSWSNSIKHILP